MLETLEFAVDELPVFFGAIVFIFGATVGSFLNVCIFRIPEERSIVRPGSRCACGAKIAWHDNIPILSWFLLRGRARCCGRAFGARYPAVEALAGALFVALWLASPPGRAIPGMAFVAFLLAATFIDIDHMIIPDRFSIGGMLLGVLLSAVFPALHHAEAPAPAGHVQGAILASLGALVGSGLVYWIAILGEIVFRKPAMGEGDVKFVGFIGAFCGWQGALCAVFGGALIGSVALAPALAWRRLAGERGRASAPSEEGAGERTETSGTEADEDVSDGLRVPFGPLLALAALIYFFGAHGWVDAYFDQFRAFFEPAPGRLRFAP